MDLQRQLNSAEEAIRDISERIEHSGTNEKMRMEIDQICHNYWVNRKKNVECNINEKLLHNR